jgi:hypothetical protein
MQLHQILAMTRFELLMMWRRGSLRIITVGLVALPLIYLLASRETYLASLALTDVSAEAVRNLNTSIMLLSTIPLLATILVAVPIILTEIIPLDRQYHVNGWLWALPLKTETYLAGKIIGVWTGLTAAMLLACAIIGLAGWLFIGAFEMDLWLMLWSGLLLFTLFTGALSVLAAATQSNRRRAVLVGLALVGFIIHLYLNAPIGSFVMQTLIMTYADVASVMKEGFATSFTSVLSLEALLAGLACLFLAGAFAWGWLRWQEYR